MSKVRDVQILPPEEFAKLEKTKNKKKAVGVPAIFSTFKHISNEMGVWKGIKLLNKMNQKDGFDCPGCAWPDPDGKRSGLGEYCENGAKAIAEEATEKRVDRNFFKKHSVEWLSTQTDYFLGKSGRITEPFYLAPGSSHYEPISWEDAFEKIANQLKNIDDPNKAVFYTSGRTSNEAAYLYQLFARQLGTNNLPDCSNMCHESSGAGLSQTLGIGKGSVTLEDFEHAEVIIVMGQNPGTNHPRMLSALEKCKKNGGKIVSVNPLPEAGNNVFVDPQNPWAIFKGGTQLTDHFLQVKLNGDVALLKALMKLMLDEELANPETVFDHEFINQHTSGYAELIEDLKNQDFEKLARAAGINQDAIKQVGKLLTAKKRIIICWAMGLTQHVNGVDNIKEVVNLLLLKGSVGIKGGGTCPVRGHSNVQGDRTMGIWEKPKEDFLSKLDDRFQLNTPREHGFDAVDAIKACNENKVDFFLFMGGNFISATPDSELTGKAMQKVKMTVQVSTKLNRSHLVTGEEALILPCLARSDKDRQATGEQFVTVENSMGIVHKSKGSLEPLSKELKSEVAIVCGIGDAMFGSNPVEWSEFEKDYSLIRDAIEATIDGFDNYNERVKKPAGFYLPNCARDQKFNTENGKANFSVIDTPQNDLPAGKLVMMTIRTHDQYNTTIYGMDDRYRGIKGERRVVLMNQNDIQKLGFKEYEVVDLISEYDTKRTARKFKVLQYDIPEGCVATYFPEANVLVPIDHTAKTSKTPVSKYVEISVVKH